MTAINANGIGRADFGLSTSCSSSNIKALVATRQDLNAKAAICCPGGYTIVAGPTFTKVLNCEPTWTGWWPEFTTSYTAKATIACTGTGLMPQLALAPRQTPAEDVRVLLDAWMAQYPEALEREETIGRINTPKELIAFARNQLAPADLQVLKDEIELGSGCKIVAPSARDYQVALPYGGAFMDLVDSGGLAALQLFGKCLDQAIQGAPSACDDVNTKTMVDGVVNINISL